LKLLNVKDLEIDVALRSISGTKVAGRRGYDNESLYSNRITLFNTHSLSFLGEDPHI
jgi:hypothetical protein